MAVTGWKTPSTIVSNGDGSYTWSDPGNAASDDNNYASVVMSTASTGSDHLKATNFGFSTSDVPSGSNIDGVEARYRRYASDASRVQDYSVKLAIGGTITGDSKATGTFWGTTEEDSGTYGGSTDTWNVSGGIADTDVRATGFGVGIAAQKVLLADRTAYIDVIEIRVYYTESTNATITGECASATASAPIPTMSLGCTVSGDIGSSTASALLPTIDAQIWTTTLPPPAEANASAPLPTIAVHSVISGECATANASALVPVIDAPHGAVVSSSTASAYTEAPPPSPQQLLYSVTGYFTNIPESTNWTNSSSLVDGNISTFSTSDPSFPTAGIKVDTPSFSSPTGNIVRVLARIYGYTDTDDARAAVDIQLSHLAGDNYQDGVVSISSTPGWTEWVDLTEAKPDAAWTWSDVETRDFYVAAFNTDNVYGLAWPVHISKFQVQVQYVPSQHALIHFYDHIRSGGSDNEDRAPLEAISVVPSPDLINTTRRETYTYTDGTFSGLASSLWRIQEGGYGWSFNSNNCPGTHLGEIVSVNIRVFNWWDGHGSQGRLYIRPVLAGAPTIYYIIESPQEPMWTGWIDITNSGILDEWTWTDLANLDVVVTNAIAPYTVPYWNHNYFSLVELQVEYQILEATISPPAASASASAPTPTVYGDANVVAVTPSATASALVPTLGADITISVGVTPSATASALSPSLNTGTSSSVSGECATASASASVPSVSTQAIISGAVSTASASALTPDISAGISIAAEYGYAQAIAPKPSIAVNIAIAGECASSSASALLPALSTGARVSGVTATANASAPAPEFSLGASVSGEVATASASFLLPLVGSIFETIGVLSPVAGSMSGALRAATIAGSMGAATRAPVIAGISALLVRRAAIAGSMAGATRQAAIAGSSSVADRDAVIAGSAAGTQRASPIAGHTGR